MFVAPASGSGGSDVTLEDLDGHLLVVRPTEVVIDMSTRFGTTDAVRATVYDVTAQKTHDDFMFFAGGLVRAFQPKVGEMVLGVLGRGEAKPGLSAPWKFLDATQNADAVAAAEAYMKGAPATAAPAAASAAAGSSGELSAALSNLKNAGLVTA